MPKFSGIFSLLSFDKSGLGTGLSFDKSGLGTGKYLVKYLHELFNELRRYLATGAQKQKCRCA